MSSRRALVLTGLAAVCASAVAFVAAQSTTQTGDEKSPAWSLTGDIEISGQVVSETGEPLQGVTINVRTSYRLVSGLTNRYEREKLVVDGQFLVVRQKCLSVELGFLKQGYFYQTAHFSAANPREQRFGGYTNRELVVVLEKKPEPAPLEQIEGILRSSVEGPSAVLKLVPGTRDAYDLTKAPKGLPIDEPFLALEAGTGSDGRIELKAARPEPWAVDYPLHSAIAFSSPGDGFLVYVPNNPAQHEDLCFREMREAPETGYAQRLEFTEEMGGYTYFYCRVGGRYGKGGVTRPSFAQKGGDTVSSRITILLNPTGSRYVATAD